MTPHVTKLRSMAAPGAGFARSVLSLPAMGAGLMLGAGLAVSAATAPPAGAQLADDAFIEVEVASIGVELYSREPLALLHSDWNEVLPIWIGEIEAAAIIQALQGVDFPRPLTHDLLVSVIDELNGTLEEVRVTELRQNTYFGLLRIRTPDGMREIDTRPSDALALAVRTNARILVHRELVELAPELDFIAASGGAPVVRLRGVTLGSPAGGRAGAEVLHVTPEIEARGLEAGDRILEVAGEAIDGPFEFLETIMEVRGSSSIEVLRSRDGVEETILLPPPRGEVRIGP